MDLKSVVEGVNKVVGAADEYITKAVRKGEEVYSHVTADPKSNVTAVVEDNEFRMAVALPGYDKNEVAVAAHRGKLTVKVKYKEGMPTHGLEFFGNRDPKFTASLPHGVDATKATAILKDGILTVKIPVDQASEPTTINVE